MIREMKFLSVKNFKTWWYGFVKEDFEKCNVGIVSIGNINELKYNYPNLLNMCEIIYLDIPKDVRIKRLSNRYDGGTVDDLLVYKIMNNNYFVVINAANIDKDVEWMRKQAEKFNVILCHKSEYFGQLAVQGPESEGVVEDVLGLPCKDLAFYTCKTLDRFDETIYLSRTGYTGEDGFEIYGSHEFIQEAWDKLLASGRCKPCGLGCRDTLRFEVGLPLYGDELSQDISPIMAGLGFFVKLDKENFIGKEALKAQKENGVERKLVGIELEGKAIPRHGYSVLKDGETVGEVTTGYHCLSVDKSVCMALVDSRFAKLGTPLDIQIRKKTFPGIVVKKKFYEKHYKKN